MFSLIMALVINNLRAIMRDRVLLAVLAVALVMILLVPVLSSFSMRQVQELAITLSLSTVSGVLLVVTLLLGSLSIWRDVEYRYTTSILTLPVSRMTFLLGKFISISIFLLLCTFVLGVGSSVVISLSAATYPSDIPIQWTNIFFVLLGDFLKYMLLAGFSLLLSSVGTSFYLPFFGTSVVYFCGNASQEVFEYATGDFGQGLGVLTIKAVTMAYYLVPNLAVFDFQVAAVYGLDIAPADVLVAALYAVVYTAILLGLAVFAFNRRQLP
jgi:ABC-type transport system involved in multi-copper enzyme maturation permease subunit